MARKKTDARTEILGRIQNGLAARVERPFPEVLEVPPASVFSGTELPIEEQFVTEFTKLGGVFVFCADADELTQNIVALAQQREWKKVMCTEAALALLLEDGGLTVTNPEEHIEDAEVCITGCEALVARTGSVVISSAQPLGRTATIYYPVHIIVAAVSQILPDLQEGLDLFTKGGRPLPSMIHFNTGPSRTADIEKTLVVGVHGPGEVILMLVDA